MCVSGQLQSDYRAQSEALTTARSVAEESRRAKDELERELQSLYAQWDADIKTQSAHFTALQATMIPTRELEILRAQMAEEFEVPHRREKDAIIQEIKHFRDAFLNEQKTSALLKTRLDAALNEHKQVY